MTIKEKADAIAAELKDLISPVTRVQLIAPNGEIKGGRGPGASELSAAP